MARFQIYETPNGPGYLLDVQADLLSDLNTRIVVPLLPARDAPRPAARLNPVFDIGTETFVMVTQFMAAVPTSELRRPVGSLTLEHVTIVNALDMLLRGF